MEVAILSVVTLGASFSYAFGLTHKYSTRLEKGTLTEGEGSVQLASLYQLV